MTDGAILQPQDDLVLILDFGAQYARLIARRVREANVYCEIIPWDTSVAEIAKRQPKALILSGGPESVHLEGSPFPETSLWDLGIPILGICYGMQLMAEVLGGKVKQGDHSEYGSTEIERIGGESLFGDLAQHLVGWMSHRDQVVSVPSGFDVIARSHTVEIAAMENLEKKFFGIQFHAEVTHTPWGADLIRRYVIDVSGCKPTWTPDSIAQMSIRNIKRQVGEGKVLCALSGGVDSVTTAVLLHEAIGENLTCLFIDHGLLRKDEREDVEEAFKVFGIPLNVIDASERFLGHLEGITDPEQKRRRIGEDFIRVFEAFASDHKGMSFLAQGTLYPDVIESAHPAGGASHTIKTHHNVGGLPEEMGFELVEPLRYFFKDEVRQVALEMGVPHHLAFRQPFPGPGLAIRIMGAVSPESLEILRDADAIVREEIESGLLAEELWQYFAVLPNVKTVGVMGDGRTYDHLIAIRCCTSSDGMTSDWPELPWKVLRRISTRIMNEVRGVNRCVYDISTKPPSTIEWE
ncbi:glutamine-hydrolyzing GMP synthase [bacterium]|nr:glutamine-hydrolyzing GMP synthase [bacterium]